MIARFTCAGLEAAIRRRMNFPLNITKARLLVGVYLLALMGCASSAKPSSGLSDRESQIVGVSLSDNLDFSQSLKVRTGDHKLTEYRYQVVDEAKPPAIALTLQGRWDLKGNQYCETVTQSSYAPWNTLIGKTQCHDISSLTSGSLNYFSSDSAPVCERKLGDAEAESLLREPFSFVSDAVRQKYGFEQH